MCVQGRERAKKLVIGCFLTKWMNSITVSLKDILESLILKIHNIFGIYASKFFVVNKEHCSPITMFMKGKNAKVSPVFQRIYVETWPSLSLFNMSNMIRLHYGAYNAYSHVFSSCFSKNLYSILSFGQL